MEVVDRCGYGKCKFFKIVKITHFKSKSDTFEPKRHTGLGKNENTKCVTFTFEMKKFQYNDRFPNYLIKAQGAYATAKYIIITETRQLKLAAML